MMENLVLNAYEGFLALPSSSIFLSILYPDIYYKSGKIEYIQRKPCEEFLMKIGFHTLYYYKHLTT